MGKRHLWLAAAALVASLLAPPTPAHAAESLRPGGPPTVAGLKVLAGSLHDHTTDSDGDAASAGVARWLKRHHVALGLDFEALTDHSDFFPLAPLGPVAKPVWARQAKLSGDLTGDGFSLLRGFEWTNDQENHINVIGSRNWTSRFVTGDAALRMEPFWQWLGSRPTHDPTGQGLGFGGADGVGQFNHPSEKGALNWDDYRLHAQAAKVMAQIEVNNASAGWYWYALAKGWNVSPTMNFDFHEWSAAGVLANRNPGRGCGTKGYLPCQRTLVLARENTPAAIEDALRQRRTSASDSPNLWATLRGPGGAWQGSTVSARPGETITLTVDAGSALNELQSVDIVTDGGIDPHRYYDGANEDVLDAQLTPSFVKQRVKYVATGGRATKKQAHEAAPGPALLASVALDGHRATKQITVRVPNVRSMRPDGKHFFYAVVHTKAGRAWTGPLFTDGKPVGRWISGDTHVHTDHSSDGSGLRQTIGQDAPGTVSVGDQIRQAERVGLGFLPLTDHRTYDQHWDPLWTSDKLILVPGEEANGSPHANVHGATDELVDGANPPGSAGYRHVQQSIWDVHAQNASWQVNHPEDGEVSGGKPNINASAVGVDVVEGWNRASDPAAQLDYVENRFNAGFRFGITGASDNHFKELWALAGPGNPTTWVFAPTPTERGIVAGLRAGHTSVSVNPDGPLVTLQADVDGDGAFESLGGDEVTRVAGARGTLRVRVRRGVGTTVQVLAAPGRSRGPVATLRVTKPDQAFTLPLGDAAWYRAEVRGVGAPPGLSVEGYQPHDALLALTSALFVDDGVRALPQAESPLPPVSAAPDGAIATFDFPGMFAGFSDVAGNHVVAEVDGGGAPRVVYRGSSGAVTLSDPDAAARFPSVATRGHDVWVVWQNQRGPQTPHRTNVVLRHSGDGGRTWDVARPVTIDGHAQHPVVEVTPDGHPVVAWMGNAGGAMDVYVRDLIADRIAHNVSANGKRVVRGNALDSRSAIFPASVFPSLAVTDERVAVAWADNRRDADPGWTGSRAGEGTAPDDWEIFVATRRGDQRWSAPVNASNDPVHADRHPAIAFRSDGALFAAWDAKVLKESGVNVSVRYATSGDGGRRWNLPAALAVDPHAMSQYPQVAAEGTAVRVVWHDSRSADWRWSIWTATVTPNGPTAATRVTGAGNALYPSLSNGRVAFTSDRHATRVQRDPTQGVFVVPAPS